MFSNRPRTYSLGVFLVGFLLICTVRAAFGQQDTTQTQQDTTQTAATTPAVVTAPVASNVNSIPNGQKTRIQGVIVSSDSCSMVVRDPNGCQTCVLITNDTNTKPRQGCGPICPGRCVKVEGRGNCSGQLVAEEIKFRGDDCNICYIDSVLDCLRAEDAQLRQDLAAAQQALSARIDENTVTAKTARAEAQAARQVADAAEAGVKANSERISALDDYQSTDEAVVTFATNRSVLTTADKAILDQFAAKALNAKGYMIEISGFTDSTGAEWYNNRLSDWRADAVMRYLVSVGNVPLERIRVVYPGGETSPVASNDTRGGRAKNRRARVRLLVSPALANVTLTQTSTDH